MSSISASGTLYFQQSGSDCQYSLTGTSWTTATWPITVTNSDTSTPLLVQFATNMTIATNSDYFVCGSDAIYWGLPTLRPDGTPYTFALDSGILNYPGLVQNGMGSGGNTDIRIQNIRVESGGSHLAGGAGWIAQSYFGGTSNFILNCSSDGSIIGSGGGIVGSSAGPITIKGCFSTGDHETSSSGGIVGSGASNITVEASWSTGLIRQSGGGIFADYANNCTATSCYSLGNIGASAGGIFGENASLFCTATSCYSRGTIGTNAGGIMGNSAASTGLSVSNCYSSGAIQGGGGIMGGNYTPAFSDVINCYTSGASTSSGNNGIYAGSNSDGISNYSEANHYSSGWTDSNSAITLQNTGTVWLSFISNYPYFLRTIGASPYATTVISNTTLVRSFSSTLGVGSVSNTPTQTGYAYIFLPNSEDFTIDAYTGVITVPSTALPGIYTLSIFAYNLSISYSPYSYTTYELTVTEPPPEPEQPVCPCHQNPLTGDIPYDVVYAFRAGQAMIATAQNPKSSFPSFGEYLRYKLALNSSL